MIRATSRLRLCQFGASGMASSGATFREILRHYYPNTDIMPGDTHD